MRVKLGHRALGDLRIKEVAVPELKAPTSGEFPIQKLQGRGHKCFLVDHHRAIQAHHRVPPSKGEETLVPVDIQWAPTTEDLHLRAPRVIQGLHITTHNRLWQCRPWLIGKTLAFENQLAFLTGTK